MNVYDDPHQAQVNANLRQIKLATHVLAEVHAKLINPLDPEEKADLLLASEDLCLLAIELVEDVRELVWGIKTAT